MLETIFKLCFVLSLSLLTATLFLYWQKPHLWLEMNMDFKAYDEHWNFNNQPMKMHLRNDLDKEALMKQNKEQSESQKRLFDIKIIEMLNSDSLPTKSYFNTTDVTNICKDKDAVNCVSTFFPLETRMRIAPKYNLASCLIQKSMSTLLEAIMCFLYNETAFIESHRVFSRELSKNRFCVDKNGYKNPRVAKKAIESERKKLDVEIVKEAKFKLLAIVRNPIDRFLSSFTDKCIRKPTQVDYCNGCEANMTCFVIKEYSRIMQQVRNKKLLRSFEDMHFFPQGWRCNFEKQLDKYHLLYYTSHHTLINDFVGQLNSFLEEQGVPHSSLDFISDQLKQGRTVHSTVSSKARIFLEKRLRSSPFLMEFVVRMYYGDYQIFDYEMPNLYFPSNANQAALFK